MVLKQVYKDCGHIPALQLSWQGGVCQSIFKSGECKIIKSCICFSFSFPLGFAEYHIFGPQFSD